MEAKASDSSDLSDEDIPKAKPNAERGSKRMKLTRSKVLEMEKDSELGQFVEKLIDEENLKVGK